MEPNEKDDADVQEPGDAAGHAEPREPVEADDKQAAPPLAEAAEPEPVAPAQNEAAEPEPAAPAQNEEPAPAAAELVDPLEQARHEAERMRNQMLRIAADFDNFRKRSRREVEDASRRSREEFLRELLPVFDNLERAASHAEQLADARAVADGVKMVLRQFHDTLGKLGITRVKTVGTPFDPNVHEAIQQLATAEQPPGTVVAEVLSGYAWDDHLVRAAMVVVAKSPPPPEPEAAPEPPPAADTSEQ